MSLYKYPPLGSIRKHVWLIIQLRLLFRVALKLSVVVWSISIDVQRSKTLLCLMFFFQKISSKWIFFFFCCFQILDDEKKLFSNYSNVYFMYLFMVFTNPKVAALWLPEKGGNHVRTFCIFLDMQCNVLQVILIPLYFVWLVVSCKFLCLVDTLFWEKKKGGGVAADFSASSFSEIKRQFGVLCFRCPIANGILFGKVYQYNIILGLPRIVLTLPLLLCGEFFFFK